MPLIAPALLAWILGTWTPAATPVAGNAGAAGRAARQEEAPSERRVNPAQPDFTVVALPTTLRVPRGKSAFRVTHRFARPLGQGDFGDLLEDFFGFDAGAQIGLEYRVGVFRGMQAGIHRTSDKTIAFFAQQDILQQGDERAFGLAALAAVEGINNFRDEYAPTFGALLSREFGRSFAVYVEPLWTGNTNPIPSDHVDEPGAPPHDDSDYTFLVGVGARWRVRPTVYLVAEIAPRAAGYDPGVNQASIGIEKRVGGHAFQVNFSNAFGTTPAQIARGGFSNDNWYIGFNISRKFF